jgi:hypothetical protein
MIVKKKINGKEYGFKFTDLTVIEYCRQRGIDFSDLFEDESKNILLSNNMMFRCAVWNYNEGKDMPSEFEMDNLINDMPQEDYDEIYNAYFQSMNSMAMRLKRGADITSKKK